MPPLRQPAPGESAEVPAIREERQTRHFDRRIGELADRQHGVVGREQLLALGVTSSAIGRRMDAGRLHAVQAGVYTVGRRNLARRGKWMAAVLASSPDAALSHRSAAALWGLRDYAGEWIHVTCGHKSRPAPEIKRHLSRLLPADEVRVHDGIPVTSVPRTIFDCAGGGDVDLVEGLLRQAEYRKRWDVLSLPHLLERYPRRRGCRTVKRALERLEASPSGAPASPLEEKFLPFLRSYGLPIPHLNETIELGGKRYRVDCRWPGTREIVELDSWEAHGTRAAFREDRERDRRLRVAGYGLTRISWAQLEDEPAAIAADLRALLSLRSSVIAYSGR